MILMNVPFFSSFRYYRKDLTVAEAIELGKRAILHAVHRDAYSGGINNGKKFIGLFRYIPFYLIFVYSLSCC
jgi:hypothetical protein